MEITQYIDNGKVKRNRIVADIKRGRITKDDVRNLVNEPDVQRFFFGNEFNKKSNQSDWNSEYLDELALASVSETFNAEYLLFLSDVVAYLDEQEKKQKERKKKIQVAIICIVIIVIVGAVIAIWISKSRNKDGFSYENTEVSNVDNVMSNPLA